MKLAPFLLALTFALPAAAQRDADPHTVLGILGGYASPSSDAFNSLADGGTSIAAYVTRPLYRSLGWRAGLGYDYFSTASGDLFFPTPSPTGPTNLFCDTGCEQPSSLRGDIGLQLGGHRLHTTMPYTFATLGFTSFALGEPERDRETDFQFAFGSGLNWSVGKHWGLGIEFRLNAVFVKDQPSDVGTQWYSATALQFFWLF